jgi:Zn-dependent M28 family amino/carboxypeptidase
VGWGSSFARPHKTLTTPYPKTPVNFLSTSTEEYIFLGSFPLWLNRHKPHVKLISLMKNTVSLTLSTLGAVNIMMQLVMPDLVPDIINAQAKYFHQLGMPFVPIILLLIWYFGGIVFLLSGIIGYSED